MEKFTFHNPTRIHFGRGQIARLARELPTGGRVLFVFGGGSIKANGVYDQVKAALGGREVVEFGGIEPNPRYETLMRAVELVREREVGFLLAVGGGSVADGVKFIAAAAKYSDGDPWRILSEDAPVGSALPLGCVLTLPATGSEMNGAAVISRGDQKLAFLSRHVYPVFSILDPEITYSLPTRQIANGVVDAFTHVLEQYLTYPVGAPLQDRMAEGVLQTLVEVGPALLSGARDYDRHATFMWCATVALNGWIGVGVPQDWATHTIGHELTALYGIDHARTLAVVLPALLSEQRRSKREKLLQWSERVWGVRSGSEDARIDAGLDCLRRFLESLGVPTRLSGHGVGADAADIVAARLEKRGERALGEHGDITPQVVRRILLAAA